MAEISAMGRRAIAVQMDILDIDQVREAVRHTAQEFERLNVFVKNVGWAIGGSLLDISEDEFDRVVALCVKFVRQC